MSSSRVAMASRSVARSRRALSPASSRPLLDEFVARGWRYRWQYGATVVASRPALGQSDRRPMLPEHFMRTVVPQMERRRARKLVAKAKPPANFRAGEVRWVAWHAPGDEYPVWGLFLSSH